MEQMTRSIARTICAHSLGGFCQYVGGSLGCKNGRGVKMSADNCIASDSQLLFSGTLEVAEAVEETIRSRPIG